LRYYRGMEKFRTHDEMRQVYTEIEQLPDRGHPYVIASHEPDKYFGFIGTSHTTDPAHPQWAVLQEEWRLFVDSANPDKIVFFEGRSSVPMTDSEEDAIVQGADSGYTRWLAEKNGIEAVSPEPDRQAEIDELVESGISEDDIIIYYISRQLAQWHRYDKVTDPDIKAYTEKCISYTVRLKWSKDYNLGEYRKVFQATYAEDPLVAGRRLLSDVSDPSINPVSSASSDIRDRSIFKAVSEARKAGKDVFTVYGSGHAIVMEHALRELIAA